MSLLSSKDRMLALIPKDSRRKSQALEYYFFVVT